VAHSFADLCRIGNGRSGNAVHRDVIDEAR
jgi:hypothetical protein